MMAGINFDDFPDLKKKSSALNFDDFPDLPQQPKARAGSAGEAFGLGIAGGQIPFGNVITSRLAAEATSPFIKQEGEGWRDAASRLYDEAQAYTKATQEESPNATLAGNLMGIATTFPAAFSKPVQGAGVIATPAKGLKSVTDFTTKMVSASPFTSSGKLAGAGNLAARMAGGAAVAAPVGGLYAAGEADAGNRMEAMGEGARNAAAFGAALPLAGAVVAPLFSKAEEMIAKKVMQSRLAGAPVADDLANSAFDKVIARLKADYPDPTDFQEVLNKFTYGNKSLVELGGERTLNLAKGAAQYPSGEAVTKEMLLPRIGQAPENIKKSVGANISKKSDYYSTLDDILEKGQAKAAPLYNEAYKFNQSVASKEIDNILATPAGKKALSDARIIMQNDRSLMGLPDKELGDLAKELQQMGMMAETQGGVASGLKLRTLDYVKKALDDQYQAAVRAGEVSNSRAILGLKRGLVDQLDKLDKTGLYAKARKTAGDYLSSKKAMESGVNYKKIDASLIQRQIAEMSPAEKDAFKVGVVKSIRDDIDNITEGGNVYQRVFGKPERQKQLKAILGNDYLKLEKDLLAEDRIYKIRNEVLANSSTASKQKAAQEFESIAQGYVTDVATMGATAGTVSAAIKATKIFIGKMFDGISDKTAGDVAKILYETDIKEKVKMINSIRRVSITPKDKQALEAYFVMSDVIKKAKANLNQKIKPAAQKTSQFVKDYLADESGALKLLPDDETIKLYRGLTKEYDPSYNLASTDAPIGYSTWTNNPELAKQYAGEKGFVYQIDLPKNKKGVELIDKNGERYLYLNNQKKAGLNNISGDEYLVYNYHEDFSPNLIKRYGDNPTGSGALKRPQLTDRYYKTPMKHADKLEDFLSQNKVDFNRETAGTGSEYFRIYKPDGGMYSVRIANHNNQSLESHKDSYDYQIYPSKDGQSGGGSVEKLINDLSEKYGYSYNSPKKMKNPVPTKEDLITKYGRNNIQDTGNEEIALKQIMQDMKYSDSLFKDIYKMDKKTIKKIMGIE